MTTTHLTFIQGNTREGLHFVINDDDTSLPLDLTGATITVYVYDEQCHHRLNTVLFSGSCTITDAINGVCEYIPIAGDMSTPGEYLVDLKIDFSNGTTVYLHPAKLTIKRKPPTS